MVSVGDVANIFRQAVAIAKRKAQFRGGLSGNRLSFVLFKEVLVPCIARRKGCSKLEVFLSMAELASKSDEPIEQFNAFNDRFLKSLYRDMNTDDQIRQVFTAYDAEQDARMSTAVYMTPLERERAQQRRRSVMKLRKSLSKVSAESQEIRRSSAT